MALTLVYAQVTAYYCNCTHVRPEGAKPQIPPPPHTPSPSIYSTTLYHFTDIIESMSLRIMLSDHNACID